MDGNESHHEMPHIEDKQAVITHHHVKDLDTPNEFNSEQMNWTSFTIH